MPQISPINWILLTVILMLLIMNIITNITPILVNHPITNNITQSSNSLNW